MKDVSENYLENEGEEEENEDGFMRLRVGNKLSEINQERDDEEEEEDREDEEFNQENKFYMKELQSEIEEDENNKNLI